MAVFEVFWDKFAGVAVFVCDLDTIGLTTALVTVERETEEGAFVTCGLFKVEEQPLGLSQPCALTIPDANVPVHLQFKATGLDEREQQKIRETDNVVLMPETHGGRTSLQSTKWAVTGGAEPELAVLTAEEPAPADILSEVYVSPREGGSVFPAVAGSAEGEGGVIEVRSWFRDSMARAEDPGARMLELTFSTVEGEHAQPTQINAFTLSAALHVLPLLAEDSTMRTPREDNFCSGTLTPDSRGNGELRFICGSDDAKFWPDHNKNVDPARRLGLLDRLIVRTSPQATIIHRDASGNLQRVGREGYAVLALGPQEVWHADEGKLVDRVIEQEEGFGDLPVSNFPSELSAAGYRVPGRTADYSDITVFCFAATLRRVHDQLPDGGHDLAPPSAAAFVHRAADYVAISLAPIDQLSYLELMNASDNRSDTAAPSDMVRKVGGAIARSHAGRLGLLETWVKSDKLNSWTVFAAALDPTIRAAATAGLLMRAQDLTGLLGRAEGEMGLERLVRDVDVLVSAGILSASDDSALEDFRAYQDRQNRLERLRKIAIDAIADVSNELGPFEQLPNSPDALLTRVAQTDPASHVDHGMKDRISRFFSETLLKKIDPFPQTMPLGNYAERVGWMFRSLVEADARSIESLVRCGLDDPIKLDSDNVRQFGFAESQPARYQAPPNDTLVSWLEDRGPKPAIIAHWRDELRQSHSNVQPNRTTGP